jgi:hypothetical protein
MDHGWNIADLEAAMESLENDKDLSSMESIHTIERMYLQCLDWNENSRDEDIVERSGRVTTILIRFPIDYHPDRIDGQFACLDGFVKRLYQEVLRPCSPRCQQRNLKSTLDKLCPICSQAQDGKRCSLVKLAPAFVRRVC